MTETIEVITPLQGKDTAIRGMGLGQSRRHPSVIGVEEIQIGERVLGVSVVPGAHQHPVRGELTQNGKDQLFPCGAIYVPGRARGEGMLTVVPLAPKSMSSMLPSKG